MSGLSYVGSKISLISKSDIRYVGILQDIDPQNATIALEQVVCYGTEGRRGNPAEEMPPTDKVFKNILFRGSDVKDLQVFEAPPPARTSTAVPPANSTGVPGYPPQRPSVARPQPPYFMNYPYGFDPYLQQPGPSPMLGGFSPYYPPMAGDVSFQPPVPSLPNNVSLPLDVPPQPLPMPPAKAPSVPNTNVESAPKPDTKERSDETAVKSQVTASTLEELARSVSELSVLKDRHAPHEQRQPQTSRQTTDSASTQRKTTARNVKSVPKKTTLKEFDFASANAKFDKTKLVEEVTTQHLGAEEERVQETDQEVHIPPPTEETFYDKAASFFDNISCESKERNGNNNSVDRRAKFQEERKLNMETFGEVSVDRKQRNYRGRHGFRGRGQNRRDNGLRGDRVVKT